MTRINSLTRGQDLDKHISESAEIKARKWAQSQSQVSEICGGQNTQHPCTTEGDLSVDRLCDFGGISPSPSASLEPQAKCLGTLTAKSPHRLLL
ncbi:hypothetical protein J6590_002645 [Homalodisca vitripennis]|nr:hypothetical protein J6590_002645 [Homalodisca vitripennis]